MRLDPRKLKEVIGYTPTKCQAEILGNLKRFNVIAGGRRSGKTYGIAAYLCMRELISQDRTIMLVAPTYTLTKAVFSQLTEWINKFFDSIFVINKSDMTIKNKFNNSTLYARSAESPKSLKSMGLSLCVIDEAGDVDSDIYIRYIRPNLSENRPELGGKQGRLVMIGNASFADSHFAQEFNKKGEDRFSYWLPTAIVDDDNVIIGSNNPDIVSPSDLEDMRMEMPETVWNQQIMARFISGEGTVLKFRDIQACMGKPLAPPRGGVRYLVGWDPAQHQDWSVVCVLNTETLEVVHIDRFQKHDWAFQRTRVVDIAKRYGDARVVLDATGVGSSQLDELHREGKIMAEGVVYTNQIKRDMVQKMMLYIEQRRVVIPSDEDSGVPLVAELAAFEFKRSKSGTITYGSPSNFHDDCVNALMLALKEAPTHVKQRVFDGSRTMLSIAMGRMLQGLDPKTGRKPKIKRKRFDPR